MDGAKVSAGGYPEWLGEPPVIGEAAVAATVTADVVVVGGGHAGVQCALAAAEKGASVAVVEEQAADVYTWFGEQVGHFNSQYLIAQGFGPYDATEIVNEFSKCSANRINQALIAMYVKKSGEMIDNVIALIDPDDDILDGNCTNVQRAYGDPAYPAEIGGYKTWAGCMQFRGRVVTDYDEKVGHMSASRLPDFERYARKRAEELGAKWYFAHSAVVLARRGKRVTGVIAKSPGGGYARFAANKGVALCCGDFSANAAMCAALMDEVREEAQRRGKPPRTITGPGRGGMGHKMGLWAGGRLDCAPRAAMTMGHCSGPFGVAPFLVLNGRGRRFMNEAATPGVAPSIQRQPLGVICGVTDAKWEQQIRLCGVNHLEPDFGRPEFIDQCREDMSKVLGTGEKGYPVRSTYTTEREKEVVYGAESLEGLADYLGYQGQDKAAWLESVHTYNRLCCEGKDSEFGKDARLMLPIDKPPYYGWVRNNKRAFVGLVTLAGLVTDDRMNVLDAGDEPIPGLYAAGNCLGGRYAVAYATPVAGNSIGMAMTHGRELGKIIAAGVNTAGIVPD